jgi:hypothetical protein
MRQMKHITAAFLRFKVLVNVSALSGIACCKYYWWRPTYLAGVTVGAAIGGEVIQE